SPPSKYVSAISGVELARPERLRSGYSPPRRRARATFATSSPGFRRAPAPKRSRSASAAASSRDKSTRPLLDSSGGGRPAPASPSASEANAGEHDPTTRGNFKAPGNVLMSGPSFVMRRTGLGATAARPLERRWRQAPLSFQS